jgi:crotonobetainyl-CoA:carnitine CoA-transferase CaiB-like acyl-CoA transferase
VTAPLEGARVVEYAQYVAGPLCGLLLADLGAEVVKVEPPAGDGYRHVLPVAPRLGRYFVPLNRGKRSVVLDLKGAAGRRDSMRLAASADIVLHNYTPDRARVFGLDAESLHAATPALVVGVVSSYGDAGPLAGQPAYDLVAQAHAGLLTAHASPGDRVPVRAGGIPLADLTAGFLLATSVLAALLRARESGSGEVVEISLLAAALALQVQDLVWLDGDEEPAPLATRADLEGRADEIAGGIAMNPYYRCFEAADGFVAVAGLNVAQRRAFLALFQEEDATVEAPDLIPDDDDVRRPKQELTARIERAFRTNTVSHWLERLRAAGVPCGPVHVREGLAGDPQVTASALLDDVVQPGLGHMRLLGPVLRPGSATSAPELGADTEAVLGELE